MNSNENNASGEPGHVTQLLNRWSKGDQTARDAVVPMLYRELREVARQRMRRERDDHTLQGTALVNEAFMRLSGQRVTEWQNRNQFLALASQIMRRILVDYARQRTANKRGSGEECISLDDSHVRQEIDSALADSPRDPSRDGTVDRLDVVAVDAALTRLTALDAQQGQIVELRYFGGLTIEETAEVMDLSPATVKREWAMARAWLGRELAP